MTACYIVLLSSMVLYMIGLTNHGVTVRNHQAVGSLGGKSQTLHIRSAILLTSMIEKLTLMLCMMTLLTVLRQQLLACHMMIPCLPPHLGTS